MTDQYQSAAEGQKKWEAAMAKRNETMAKIIKSNDWREIKLLLATL
jgi:hypothetical protein